MHNNTIDSITFAFRITFEQVWKQHLKVKKSIKRLLNAIYCQLQMAPMTPFDTIIWPIFPKDNRPMSRPHKSTPGPNRDSKVPS